MTQTKLILRPFQPRGAGRHASWLELFFDLVFVVAIAQIAHRLDQINLAHVVTFVGLLSVVWWTWLGYTFYADFFENDALLYRLAMFLAMFSVIGLAVNAGDVLTTGGVGFAASCVVVRAVLLLLYQGVYRHVPVAQHFAGLVIQTYSVSALVWLASIFAPPPWRFWMWAAALTFEIVNSMKDNRIVRTMPFNAEHIAERLGLFTVLVLGEAVFSLTRGLDQGVLSIQSTVTAMGGFGVLALLWWVYFELTAIDVARHGWTPRFLIFLYAHLPLSLGIVVVGAGLGKLLAPGSAGVGSAQAGTLVAVGAGLALATMTVLHGAAGSARFWAVRVAASTVLFGLPLVLQTPMAFLVAVLGTLLFVVVTETITSDPARSPGTENARLEGVSTSLEAGSPAFGTCDHTTAVRVTSTDQHVCEACLREGIHWVELRLCMVCGYVGCCDSGVGRHSAAHFRATGHPVMRSIEPGEAWGWCYLDQRFIDVPVQSASAGLDDAKH